MIVGLLWYCMADTKSENSSDMKSQSPKSGATGIGVIGATSSRDSEKGAGRLSGYIAGDRILLEEESTSTAAPSGTAADAPTADDDETTVARDGFAVYEPPPASEGTVRDKPAAKAQPGAGSSEEWASLADRLFESYGDTLQDAAKYSGPIGAALTGSAALLILLRLVVEASSKVISGYVLIISAGAFIIGVFLLLFHVVHRISNRNKSAALAEDRKRRMLEGTCKFLDVYFPGTGILLKCKYFKQDISTTPECLVCTHYDPTPEVKAEAVQPISPPATDRKNITWDNDEGAVVAAPLSKAKPASKERQLLMEMEMPKIGGASGGDLDEDAG